MVFVYNVEKHQCEFFHIKTIEIFVDYAIIKLSDKRLFVSGEQLYSVQRQVMVEGSRHEQYFSYQNLSKS